MLKYTVLLHFGDDGATSLTLIAFGGSNARWDENTPISERQNHRRMVSLQLYFSANPFVGWAICAIFAEDFQSLRR